MEKSFKQRVIEFWAAFEKEEANLRSLMDSKADAQTLVGTMNRVLNIAFNDPYFQMGINDEGKYELILTPEGDRARLFQLHYCVQNAPAKLLEKWNFYSSKPGDAKDHNSMEMYGISLKAEDMKLYYEADTERSKVNIQVYCPKLMELEENERYNMFFIFLDQYIGELYTMEYIGYIDFVEAEQVLPEVSIADFKDLIDKIVKENEWATLDNPYELFSGYQLEPTEEDGWQLREDVYIGMTSCIPVINKFLQHDSSLSEEFEADGVVFGFLFYENINVPQERMVPQRSEIEDKIMAIAEPQGIAFSIGGATGFHFSYMDFIIYDYDAFMEIAKEVFASYDFEEVGFSKFIFGDEPVWIGE